MNGVIYMPELQYIKFNGSLIILPKEFFCKEELPQLLKEINIARCIINFNTEASNEIKDTINNLIKDHKITSAIIYIKRTLQWELIDCKILVEYLSGEY
jgi:hypothetical protein